MSTKNVPRAFRGLALSKKNVKKIKNTQKRCKNKTRNLS